MRHRPRGVLQIALPEDIRERVKLTVVQPVLALFEQQALPLWLACPWDARPPTGLAGRCDWRLRGLLSRGLQQERLGMDFGNVALVGASQRLLGARLVLFGMGSADQCDEQRLAEAARRTAELVRNLGHTRYALEAPCPDGASPTSFLEEHVRCRLAEDGLEGALELTLVVASAAVVATDVTMVRKITGELGAARSPRGPAQPGMSRNILRVRRRRLSQAALRHRYQKISSRDRRAGRASKK